MTKKKEKHSGLPLSIIALVFVILVIGGIWFYNSSRPRTATTASNTSSSPAGTPAQRDPANAPLGAPIGINMIGSPDAAVTVEEFADFQCGACASVHPMMKELQSAYAGNRNFRFVFRHFPLTGHDKAFDAAVATEAAGLQGKYWQMQDQLFRNQAAWAAAPNYRDLWTEYAENIGMDVQKFKSDIAGMQTKQRVELDLARARALGVSSTPTVFINGQSVPYPQMTTDAMRRLIDQELQRAASSAAANSAAPGNAAPAANSSNTAN
jgi:protein-disulfide isomerase